jgi:hypothetical protein
MEANNPYQAPQAPAIDAASLPTKRFRLRLIPATLLYIFGGLGILGHLPVLGMRLWLLATGGRQPVLRDVPPVWGSLAYVASGALAIVAAAFWMRGRWKLAILATLVFFIVSAVVNVSLQMHT